MNIVGMQKLSLLDYPDMASAIIFTKGCNFKCPFCQNSNLIENKINEEDINEDEVLEYLNKRKKVLDGLVISGGEPTLQKDLKQFIKKVKKIGLKVKLDTNGFNPKIIRELIDENLVDYIAMDVKNEFCKYNTTCGMKSINTKNILESIKILESSNIEYEFRTTITKEFHDINSIKEILKIIGNKPKYFLQNFCLSDNVLDKSIHGFTYQELVDILDNLKDEYQNVNIRDLYKAKKGDEVHV